MCAKLGALLMMENRIFEGMIIIKITIILTITAVAQLYQVTTY